MCATLQAFAKLYREDAEVDTVAEHYGSDDGAARLVDSKSAADSVSR